MKVIKTEKIEMTGDEKWVFDKAFNMAGRLAKEVTNPDLSNILINIMSNIADLTRYIEEVES